MGAEQRVAVERSGEGEPLLLINGTGGSLPAKRRFVTLPRCGHTPMWDAPDLVARTILEGAA